MSRSRFRGSSCFLINNKEDMTFNLKYLIKKYKILAKAVARHLCLAMYSIAKGVVPIAQHSFLAFAQVV